jgi:hypothetical protein
MQAGYFEGVVFHPHYLGIGGITFLWRLRQHTAFLRTYGANPGRANRPFSGPYRSANPSWLEEVLHSDHFEQVRSFPMRANYHAQESKIVVYKNLGHVAQGPINLNIEIPMINRTISGVVGKD